MLDYLALNTTPKIFAEVLWVFSTWATIILHHTFNHSLPIKRKSFKLFGHIVLLSHLSLALIEAIWYYLPALSKDVAPGIMSLTLCLAHSITSLQLARDRSPNDNVLDRPAFQTLTIFRLVLSSTAFARGSVFCHRASTRILASFTYPRLITYTASRFRILPPRTRIYTVVNLLSAILAIHDTEIPLGPQLFLVAFLFNILLNRWVALQIVASSKRNKSTDVKKLPSIRDRFIDPISHLATKPKEWLCFHTARLLIRAGFCELHTVHQVSCEPDLQKMVLFKDGEKPT